MAGYDEFDWINYIASLAGPEGLDLRDDAAILPARPGYDLVVTQDTIVEGVHFLPGTPLHQVSAKLLRVNYSDLAAKGAAPYGYFLSVAWPDSLIWDEKVDFTLGLSEAQEEFGGKVFGGDTVSTPGPLTATVTMTGFVPEGQMVRRDDARVDDLVMVSGTIGDGWLGLKAAQGELSGLSTENHDWLLGRYLLPNPRVDVSVQHLHACADVSDGLVADAGNIARASGVRIEIFLDTLPLSAAAKNWLDMQPDREAALLQLATGGDDYELVGTGPHATADFTIIGQVMKGEGVAVIHNGKVLELEHTGWRHGKKA